MLMVAPAVESIDLFSALIIPLPARGGFPCSAAIPQNNTSNNTFVSQPASPHEGMLLVDRVSDTASARAVPSQKEEFLRI